MFNPDKPGDSVKFEKIRILYDERIQDLKVQVQNFFKELENDEIFNAVKENSYSREFSVQRAGELFDLIMKSEQEITISKLQKKVAEGLARNKYLEDELAASQERLLRICEEKIKIENQVDLEKSLKETELKFLNTRKELDTSLSNIRSSDLLSSEIEFLRQELKIREDTYLAQSEDLKKFYESKITDIENSYDSILAQFKGYQRQAEVLAADHQQVIKKLVDKTKKMKSKILSQKAKIEDLNKGNQETLAGLERTVEDYKEKIQSVQKEAAEKEVEIFAKHRTQLVQLQNHYQQLMNVRLEDMQKQVDEQVRRSQDHDLEVKTIMDVKLKEVERDFMLKSLHEKILNDKENTLVQFYTEKLEEAQQENNELNQVIQKNLLQIDSLLKEKESTETGLKNQLETTKNLENRIIFTQKDLEKESKLRKNLEKELEKCKKNLLTSEESTEKLKVDFQLTLLQKVNKEDHENLQEKLFYLSKELENKSIFISNLENEIQILGNNLSESANFRVNDQRLLENEREKLREAKINLQKTQEYSEHLLAELEYKEQQMTLMKSSFSNYQQEIRSRNEIIESKDKDVHTFKQLLINKEAESRVRSRLKLETYKKSAKSFVLHFKSVRNEFIQMFLKESSVFNRLFDGLCQEINSKVASFLSFNKRNYEVRVEKLQSGYKRKLEELEESIKNEELYWNDAETEGIRRSVKALIESRQIALIENRTLKETVFKLQQDNTDLYNQTKSLHTRFHQTMKLSEYPDGEFLPSKFTSSLRDPLKRSRY
jgi:hypothetical protein